LRSTVSSACFDVSSSRRPLRNIVNQPSMAVSGVRSSCERVARNLSFTRVGALASAARDVWGSQQFLTLLLGPLLLGDVAGDLRSADNFAAGDNWRDCERHIDPVSVFGHAHGLVVIEELAASQPGKNCR